MINVDNLPLKYITGSYRFDKGYPSDVDFLYDLAQTGKSSVKLDSIDWVEPDTAIRLCETLANAGYVKYTNDKVTIIKTPWDD